MMKFLAHDRRKVVFSLDPALSPVEDTERRFVDATQEIVDAGAVVFEIQTMDYFEAQEVLAVKDDTTATVKKTIEYGLFAINGDESLAAAFKKNPRWDMVNPLHAIIHDISWGNSTAGSANQ